VHHVADSGMVRITYCLSRAPLQQSIAAMLEAGLVLRVSVPATMQLTHIIFVTRTQT
jgi:hypothetical protein